MVIGVGYIERNTDLCFLKKCTPQNERKIRLMNQCHVELMSQVFLECWNK